MLFLFLPVTGQSPHGKAPPRTVEIQLSTVPVQPPDVLVPGPEVQAEAVEPMPESVTEPWPPRVENPAERQAEAVPAEAQSVPREAEHVTRIPQRDLENMSQMDQDVLTSTILARQFFTEESAVDKLFGKPLVRDSAEFQKEFHYPLRPDLLEMLDRPLPDMPFAYTPGLVYFAYDPGLKGDLQRFWDIITPEFGWRTRYGTEVKCGLILIIVGCVWK